MDVRVYPASDSVLSRWPASRSLEKVSPHSSLSPVCVSSHDMGAVSFWALGPVLKDVSPWAVQVPVRWAGGALRYLVRGYFCLNSVCPRRAAARRPEFLVSVSTSMLR